MPHSMARGTELTETPTLAGTLKAVSERHRQVGACGLLSIPFSASSGRNYCPGFVFVFTQHSVVCVFNKNWSNLWWLEFFILYFVHKEKKTTLLFTANHKE